MGATRRRTGGATVVPRRDRGQAVLLVLPIVAIAAMLGLAAARAGVVLADRAQAQAAADAAALAAVEGGAGAASRIAAANGAALVACSITDDGVGTTVTVTVQVGDVTASARATNGP